MGSRFFPCQAPWSNERSCASTCFFSHMSPVWRPSDCFLSRFFLSSLSSRFSTLPSASCGTSLRRSIASRGNSFHNDTRKVQHSKSRQCSGLDPSMPFVLRCHSTPSRSNFFVTSVLVFFAYHGTVGQGWLVLCLGQAFDSSGLRQAALAQRLSFSVLVRSEHRTGGPGAGKDLASLTPIIQPLFPPYTHTTIWF